MQKEKTVCLMCNNSPCWWCKRRCRWCWLTESVVIVTNWIIERYELQWDTDKINKLKQLAQKWYYEELLVKWVIEWVDVEKLLWWTQSYWMCEYPLGSMAQWARCPCIHCWKPRFEWMGKPCPSLIDKL